MRRLDQRGNLFAQPGNESIDSIGNQFAGKGHFPGLGGLRLSGYMSLGRFIDIGTPEDFAAVENFFAGMKQHRYVVLDRDGTIIEEREYLSGPDQVALLPGVGAALRDLREMGFGLVVTTDQSGVRRGFFDQGSVERDS